METLQSTIFIEFDVNTKKITFLRGDSVIDYDSNVTNIYVRMKYKDLSGNTTYLSPVELENYDFSLYTIKPLTKNVTEINGKVTDELKENIYGGVVKFEIPRGCTNRLGIVKCEIHIKQGNKMMGSSTFVLDIKQSLVTAFDDEILDDEDFPVLKQLILEIQNAININDSAASATTTYSSNKIESIKTSLNSQITNIKTRTDNIINDTSATTTSTYSSSKIERIKSDIDSQIEAIETQTDNIINDTTPSASTTYSSDKIESIEDDLDSRITIIETQDNSEIDDSKASTSTTYSSDKIEEIKEDLSSQIEAISGSIDLSGYVTKTTGNASQITFSDGQTFQAKLDAGTLKGEKGDQGEPGPSGADNIDDTTARVSTTYSSNKIENIKQELTSQIESIGGTGSSYDDTEIKGDIQILKDNQIILVEDETSMEGISDKEYPTLNTQNKTLIGAINEVKNLTDQGGGSYDDTEIRDDIQTLKDSQIILLEDETSIDGISDKEYPTLTTQNKTLIGAINEIKDFTESVSGVDTSRIPASTSVESNKLYLKNSAGQKIDSGTVLPTGSSEAVDASIIAVSTVIESNRLYLRNSAGQKIDNGTLLPTSSSGSSGSSSGSSDTLSEAQRNIIINEILDGVVPKYKTKAQYDVLTDDQKNDTSIEYHITDVEGVILTSPNGTQFKLKVANDGTLSTERL